MAQYPDTDISCTVVNKFCSHLWYLVSENVGLAFFDSHVPKDIKLKVMADNVKKI